MKPDKDKEIQAKQETIKHYKDTHTRMQTFEKGEKVGVKSNSSIRKWYWENGIIHKVMGKVTYLVKCRRKIRYCHADHLRANTTDIADVSNTPEHFEIKSTE